jgi:uncharacterized protein involved in response to NO
MTALSHPEPRGSMAISRAWRGAAILSRGFRPFFLAAGVWAVVGMALWPAIFSGTIIAPTEFSTVDWHAHEMIFGYAGAVVAGFLLTAIPNWTGRLPVAGAPLAALTLLWAVGRIAVAFSAEIGRTAAGAVDCAFLSVFAAVVAAEVASGRNARNAKVAVLVAALALANVAFHVEDARTGLAEYSARAALALLVFLILLIGGRVTPSFTNNWLAKAGIADRSAPFAPADGVALAASGLALVAWVVATESPWTGAALLLAGAANLWRLSRWRGLATRGDALYFVLHAGYALTALGFIAAGAGALWSAWISYAVGVHVSAIGGVGMMTLAMMTRATLGHTGRALTASTGTKFAYFCVAAALVARVGMTLAPDRALLLMHIAALAWMAGFLTFVIAYGPMLARRSARLTAVKAGQPPRP